VCANWTRALTGFEEDDVIKAVVISGAGSGVLGRRRHSRDGRFVREELAERQARRANLLARRQFSKPISARSTGSPIGGAALLSSRPRHPHRLRTLAIPFPGASYGRVIRAGRCPMLVAGEGQGLLYTGRVVHAEEPSHRFLNMIVRRPSCATADRDGRMIAKNDARMCRG